MKQYYLIIALLFTALSFSQERVNAALPKLNPVASGRIPEVTGWTQNDAGEWLSRKNRIPSNLSGEDKILLDHENEALGEDRENFIDISVRDVTINDSVYSILIKKFKDGFYKYSSIREGWIPTNNLDYFVFRKEELNKFKNLEPNRVYEIKIDPIYTNDQMVSVTGKDYLKLVSEDLFKEMKKNQSAPSKKLVIYFKLYNNKVRFIIQSYTQYLSPNFTIDEFEKRYYETTKENFEKLFKLS